MEAMWIQWALARQARLEIDPQWVGSRTLLAKTCKQCGELRPGSAFHLNHLGKHHCGRDSVCTRCRKRRSRELIRQDETRRIATNEQSARAAKRRNHAMPQPRGGYQWTGPELEIIEREDLTAQQAGLMIGRSLSAVYTMRWLIRNEPKYQRVLGAQP
jgi:hypothetical protein